MTEALTKKADEKYCHECGAIIRAKAEICPKCGVRQHDVAPVYAAMQTPPPERSRLAAALLAIFLGIIGAHKFYLGRTIAGVIYLLFCWTIIPAIIGLIEGICYLAMSEREFQSRYGSRGHALTSAQTTSFELSPDAHKNLQKIGTVIAWILCAAAATNLVTLSITAAQKPASDPDALFHGNNAYGFYIMQVSLLLALCPLTRPLIQKFTGIDIGMGGRFFIFIVGAIAAVAFIVH
jgi:TM2 domain-containing membrane protein YozV